MRALIVANADNEAAKTAAGIVDDFLRGRGIWTLFVNSDGLPGAACVYDEQARVGSALFQEELDLAVVLAGDGTILKTARVAYVHDIPILGINYGTLGFLANSPERGVVAMVEAALEGRIVEEQRACLIAEASFGAEAESASSYAAPFRKKYFALNEVLVSRPIGGRVVEMTVDVSGDKVAHLRGDGVMLATATGSTAYALSAGGPLAAPGYRGQLIVPLAPHSLQSRSIVTENNDFIEVNLVVDGVRSESVLFVDGELQRSCNPVERVVSTVADRPVRLLKYSSESFYRRISDAFFRHE